MHFYLVQQARQLRPAQRQRRTGFVLLVFPLGEDTVQGSLSIVFRCELAELVLFISRLQCLGLLPQAIAGRCDIVIGKEWVGAEGGQYEFLEPGQDILGIAGGFEFDAGDHLFMVSHWEYNLYY